jgi:superfamily II DNA or RNA helicase
MTAKKNNSVIILTHRQELLRQTSDKLEDMGISHGIIAAGHSMSGDSIQVASVQTLVRRLDQIRRAPELIIIDEAHHTNAGTWRKVVQAFPSARLLGVTATPVRLDGTGLGQTAGGYFDTLIEGPTIRDLIDQGFLAPPIVYAPPTDVDFSKVKITMGDFAQKEIAHKMDVPTITGCAIEHYQRICPGVPAIAFCATVKHAEHVAEQFNAAGIAASSIDGTLSSAVRKYRIQALANGQLSVLTSCEIISEGTDIPVVTAAIMLRPTQSTGLYLQQAGRVLRPHDAKTHAIILDHVGNCVRHGLVDDVRAWSLMGSKRKRIKEGEEVVKIRKCAKCFAVFSWNLPHCPQCGTNYAMSPGNGRDVKQVSGNLVQITKADIDAIRMKRRLEIGMAHSLEDLVQIGKSRGYHPGWAGRIWNVRRMKYHTEKHHTGVV